MNTHTAIASRVHYERTAQGIDVYLTPTHATDIVICTMAIPGGLYASYDHPSIPMIITDLLPASIKGTTRRAIRERLDAYGARITIQEDLQTLTISLACRTSVFLDTFELLMDILCKVVFTQKEYVESLTHVHTSATHAQEDTATLARVACSRELYDYGHPHWKSHPRDIVEDLGKISRDEVSAYYKSTLTSVGALVCITGDIKPRAMLPRILRALTALPQQGAVSEDMLHPERTKAPQVLDTIISLRDKMNIDSVLTLPLALTEADDAYHALLVGVRILGGSASARLFDSLRNRQSLTYGAYARMAGFDTGYAGFITAMAIFPNDVFLKGRTALRAEVSQWAEKGVTAKELASEKEEICGSAIVQLASTTGIARALFATIRSKKTPQYLDEYPALIQSLTLREVNSAIKQHVRYDLAVTASAGAIGEDGLPLP
jgi:zinc protease